MLQGTAGQLLVNEALPESLRDLSRVLDKKGLTALLSKLAKEQPDDYRDTVFKLTQIGRAGAQESGGMSFGMQHLRKSEAAKKIHEQLRRKLMQHLDDDSIDDDERTKRLVSDVRGQMEPHEKAIYEEALKANNPLARMIQSGTRGNATNLAGLIGSDMLYVDHRDRPIPIPVFHSYSQGQTPSEYMAGAYGARKSVMATKFATQEAGFLSKQLNQVSHRLIVSEDDEPDAERRSVLRGLPVDTSDPDNEGALLAAGVGPYKAGTPLTAKVLNQLSGMGHKRILIRSPVHSFSADGGVYGKDVGIRERGTTPWRGEMVGLQAAQALSEPISQGQLSAKHSGGVAGAEKAVSGFAYINQLIQRPKTFKGGAAHAQLDGTVQRVEDAPAGGKYITINDKRHYVGQGYDPKVKRGDKVEAGDVISDGIPNPGEITQYKGLGEGKRYFVSAMMDAMRSSNMKANRRNVELLARGLINHVRFTGEHDEYVPDDVVPYSAIERRWTPREGHQELEPSRALGQYLERPVLHHAIGTQIKPSMLADFKQFGVNKLFVHKNPPPFQPEMIRGMTSLQHDEDWMTRMYGSGLQKSLLDAVHRGGTSDEAGSSFVPGLARSVNFGRVGVVKSPARPSLMPVSTTAETAVKIPEINIMPKMAEDLSVPKYSGGSSSSVSKIPNLNLLNSATAPLVDKANQMAPGIGGVGALAGLMSARDTATLTSGLWNRPSQPGSAPAPAPGSAAEEAPAAPTMSSGFWSRAQSLAGPAPLPKPPSAPTASPAPAPKPPAPNEPIVPVSTGGAGQTAAGEATQKPVESAAAGVAVPSPSQSTSDAAYSPHTQNVLGGAIDGVLPAATKARGAVDAVRGIVPAELTQAAKLSPISRAVSSIVPAGVRSTVGTVSKAVSPYLSFLPYAGEAYRYGRHLQDKYSPGWLKQVNSINPQRDVADLILGGPEDYLNNDALTEGTTIDTSKGVFNGVVAPSLEAANNPIRSLSRIGSLITPNPFDKDTLVGAGLRAGTSEAKRLWNRSDEHRVNLSNLTYVRDLWKKDLAGAQQSGDQETVKRLTNALAQNAKEILSHGGQVE